MRSSRATPAQEAAAPGPPQSNVPSEPFRATTSYEPKATSSPPSMSTTAGELYLPVWHHDAKQPPYAHFSTGTCTTTCARSRPDDDVKLAQFPANRRWRTRS